MELRILDVNHQRIARVIAEEIAVRDTQDMLDIMASAYHEEAMGIILEAKHLDRDFFNLCSGLAGDILQKCANYQMKLAVVGDFEKSESKSLAAFIVECNRGSSVFFVADVDTAVIRLTGQHQ